MTPDLQELCGRLQNWQREMERSCDALREIGPEMEEAALGNAYVAEALEDARDALTTQAERIAKLEAALERIERWSGEFPETGRTWDDGEPMSYGACFGSNGERDFMRGIARAALEDKPL